MKIWVIPVVLAIAAALLLSVVDYGSTKQELTTTKLDLKQTTDAAKEVDLMAADDAATVAAAIDNSQYRDQVVNEITAQVAENESKAQNQRDVNCNLSADTVARMRDYAKPDSPREQLEAGARIHPQLATSEPGCTGVCHASRDGQALLRERSEVLGSSVRSHRSATFRPDPPEGAAET